MHRDAIIDVLKLYGFIEVNNKWNYKHFIMLQFDKSHALVRGKSTVFYKNNGSRKVYPFTKLTPEKLQSLIEHLMTPVGENS